MSMMISSEVLRINPDRENATIRTSWGDIEVNVFDLMENIIWKSMDDHGNSSKIIDILVQLDSIKENTRKPILK